MKIKFGLLLLALFALFLACNEEPKILRIGALIPMSGTMEAYGRNVKNGLMLALSQINDGGGIKGTKLDIIFEDDGSDENTAVKKVTQMIKSERVPAIIGGISSGVALAIAPVCQSSKVVLLSPTASSPKFSSEGDYVFRNYPSDTHEGRVMAEYAVRRMKVRSVGVLYIDNEYGQGIRDVFKQKFTGLGGIVTVEKSFQEGATDFVDAVKELKAAPSDGVYVIGYYQEVAAILKEIKKQKVTAKLFSVQGMNQPIILETATDAAEGVVYPQPPYNPDSSDPAIQKFVSSYKAKFDTKPDIDAAFAYDALRIIAKAMENSAQYPDDLRARVADTNMKGLIGDIAFDSNGDVDITPRMYQVKDGKFVPVD